jgi:hypothetical protein
MSATIENTGLAALASMRRASKRTPAFEYCHLCRTPLGAEHEHVLELASGRLCCACEACAILFSQQGTPRYRRVPRRAEFLANIQISDPEWEQLHLPINLAFFVRSTTAGRMVAYYPSPAGATESLPSEQAWQSLVENNPVLAEFEPDVEALLANRLVSPAEYFRVGIDDCFKLVGLIRKNWRGLAGGPEVWKEIGGFFAELKGKCHGVGEPSTA